MPTIEERKIKAVRIKDLSMLPIHGWDEKVTYPVQFRPYDEDDFSPGIKVASSTRSRDVILFEGQYEIVEKAD